MAYTSNLSFIRKNPITTLIATVAIVTSGVFFRVTKATPTVAIRNESIFELKTSSGVGLTVDGSGSLTASGKILSQRNTDLGWAVVAGANAACNTTCTSACVFGVNTAATEADIVGCVDATADECLCAGAN